MSLLFGVLLGVTSILGCSSGSTNDDSAIVLKLGHGTATSSLFHTGATKFKELIEAKSGGQIKVDIHSDGILGFDTELVNYMKSGNNVQMGMNGNEVLSTLSSKLKVVNLPYIFPDRETAYEILDGEIGDEMVADLPEKHGVRVLAYFENGFRHMTNSKHEIHSPDDLKGLKFRTPLTPVSLSIFNALGANPTALAWGEVYTALEQKMIDGQENPASIIYTSKLAEVQKYLTVSNHMYSPVQLVISENAWKKLTPEQQQWMMEAAVEARDYQRQKSMEEEEEAFRKLEEEGVVITRPDLAPFIEATKDVHFEFDEEYGADFYEKVYEATRR